MFLGNINIVKNFPKQRRLATSLIVLIVGLLFYIQAIANELPKLPDVRDVNDDPLIYIATIELLDPGLLIGALEREIIGGYQYRYLSYADLTLLSQNLTRQLAAKGFVNSGVVVPDQEIREGRLVLQVIPGKLAAIEVKNQFDKRVTFAEEELRRLDKQVLNINDLQQNLKLLEADQRIQRIQAEILPTKSLGEAKLKLFIEESNALQFDFLVNNYISPNVGEYQVIMGIRHLNLTGHGDIGTFSIREAEGLTDVLTSYFIPIAFGIGLDLEYEESASEVVAEPFAMLELEGESSRYELGLSYPFVNSINNELNFRVALERQEVKSYLFGNPFSFSSLIGDEPTVLTVLRIEQSWVRRQESSAYYLFSQFSFGLDALGATIGGETDSEFASWLGQLSWVRQNKFMRSEFYINTAFQIANDNLLGVEKFSLGGVNTVRGYRENLIATDNAIRFSMEWRIPLLQIKIPGLSHNATDGQVSIAPFYDYAQGENSNDFLDKPISLSSVGLSVQWQLNSKSYLRANFAHALEENIFQYDNQSLQDQGIQFEVSVGW
jgi:hemolysin activation/secretion protein